MSSTILVIIIIALWGYSYYIKLDFADKLTHMHTNKWLTIFLNAGKFEKGRLATAILTSGIERTKEFGITLSVREVMREKNKSNIRTVDFVIELVRLMYEDMTQEVPQKYIDRIEAGSAFALVIFKMEDEEGFRKYISDLNLNK